MNRFDLYISTPYLSQYTPIPFEQIMNIGERYNALRKEAELNLALNILKFGTFKSASQADTDSYYRETIGRLEPLLKRIEEDPNAMRDSAFRSAISSMINSTDYKKLAGYQETALNLETYNKVKADMKTKGLFNQAWEDPRMNNWSTDLAGVMNELAPILYKSLQELSRPYVEGIKPTFYKGRAPISGSKMAYTNWMAITPQERFKELDAHKSDIMSTPQGQKWYEDIAARTLANNPNATKAELDDAFMNSLMTVTSWKDAETPVVDTASLLNDIARIKAGGSRSNNPNGLFTRVSKVQSDAQDLLNRVNLGIIERNSAHIAYLKNQYKKDHANSKLTDEQLTFIALMQTIAEHDKKYGVSENTKIPLLKEEYLNYWGSLDTVDHLKEKGGDKKLIEIKSRPVEAYNYRYGDMPLTTEGKLLERVNNAFVSGDKVNSSAPGGYGSYLNTNKQTRKKVNTTSVIDIIKLLSAKTKFEPEGDAFVYSQTGNYDPSGNVIKANGRLYVKEDDLREAIKQINPKLYRDYYSLFTKGFDDGNQHKYLIALKVKGATPDGDDDWYEIKMARSWGNSKNLNDRFNSLDIKDNLGTSLVKDNNVNITASSWLEAANNSLLFDSSF